MKYDEVKIKFSIYFKQYQWTIYYTGNTNKTLLKVNYFIEKTY